MSYQRKVERQREVNRAVEERRKAKALDDGGAGTRGEALRRFSGPKPGEQFSWRDYKPHPKHGEKGPTPEAKLISRRWKTLGKWR